MTLSHNQVSTLLSLVVATEDDGIGCDDCYVQMASFAEAEIEMREIPEALRAVETHLGQCLCCKQEYEHLILALRAMQEAEETF